jgi:hypothetical protein
MAVTLNQEQYDNFAASMRKISSNDNYTLVSDDGYVGAYQLSAGDLAGAGYIDRRKYIEARTSGNYDQKEFLADENNWTIDGGLPVYLNNQQLQDQAMQAHTSRNLRELEAKGAINDNTNITEVGGTLGVAHQFGPDRTIAFKERGPSALGDGLEGVTAASYQIAGSGSLAGGTPVAQAESFDPARFGPGVEQQQLTPEQLQGVEPIPSVGELLGPGIQQLTQQSEEFTGLTFEAEPTQVSGGGSANKSGASFTEDISNVEIPVKENPLSKFASYTYNIALYQMGIQGYINLMKSEGTSPLEAVNSVKKVLVARSGGLGQDINNQFDIDFFIDSLQMTNVGSPSRNGANTNAVDISFEIFEPRGITLIERLKDAAQELGESTNYVATPYLLQITFTAYDDNGAEIRNPILPRFIPIKITELKFEITASGAAYKVTAVPFHQNVFASINNTIPLNIQVKATNVGDIFSKNVDSFIDISEELDEAESGFAGLLGADPRSAGLKDVHALIYKQPRTLSEAISVYNENTTKEKKTKDDAGVEKIVPAEAELYDEIDFNPGGSIASSKLVKEAFDALNTDMGEQGEAFKEYADAVRGQVAIAENEIFRINAGTGIVGLLNFVIIASDYMERNVKDDTSGAGKGQNQPVYWFKVKPKIMAVKGWDGKQGRYKYKVRYDVLPMTVYYSDYPWAPRSKPNGDGFHKKYNYIFSGENTEVINFKIDFNTAYYQANQFGTGVPDASSQPVDTTFPIVKQAQTVSPESENLKSDKSLDAKRSKDLMSTIMTEGADLVELKMDIIGDPDYIPTGDGFFQKDELAGRMYTKPYWPDGTINYDLTIPHVQVNFKTPTEYNDITGLMDPAKQTKYSSSAFSGIYKVIEVKSTFQGGTFTQNLLLVRTKVQPDSNGNIPQQSYQEAFAIGTPVPDEPENKKPSNPNAGTYEDFTEAIDPLDISA